MFISESYLEDLEKKKKKVKKELKKAKKELKKVTNTGLKYAGKGLDYFEKTDGGQSYKAQKTIFEPLRKAKEYLKDKEKSK